MYFNQYNNLFDLGCGHAFCINCLKNKALKDTKQSLNEI